jgi:hypothetical protein
VTTNSGDTWKRQRRNIDQRPWKQRALFQSVELQDLEMASAIEDFIIAQNISLYRSLLKTEMQPAKRRILLQLLENELAKLPEALKRVETARISCLR